jgi:hypothetical protein
MNYQDFIGPSYSAAATLQDNQMSINWYVEVDQNAGAKTPKALLSAPGLVDLGQSVYTGEVRGMYVTRDPGIAIVVVGASVLRMQPVPNPDIGQRPTFTYSLLGALVTTTGPVSIRDNGAAGICVIVDGPHMYVYNEFTGIFTMSSDPAFLGAYLVTEVDGWLTFLKPDSQIFYTSPLYWDGSKPFDGTYFALKDDAHDNAVAIIENNRELWLIGEETTEIWYNQGGTYFPWSRLQGTMQQVGCAAVASVARYSNGLIWLGRTDRGNNQVILTKGYSYTSISNPALAYQLNQYADVSDAKGYVYSEEGHDFYVLILPSANATWVYDLTTEMWHQRASWDPVNAVFNRQRANCMMNFQGMIIVGDYQTGQIYWQTRSAYTDGNYPLVSLRRAPHMWDNENRNRIRYDRLQLEFKPGSASQTGTYTDPQAILTWSDDGGQTFGNAHYASIGKSGQTTNRCIWRRLGIARDRVFQVIVSDPVNRDITGASVMGMIYKT